MLDLNESSYFKSLPMMIQENIWQSGTKFTNETELRNFVSHLNDEDRM